MWQNLSEGCRRHLSFCALKRNAVIEISYTWDALCQNGDLKRWPKITFHRESKLSKRINNEINMIYMYVL